VGCEGYFKVELVGMNGLLNIRLVMILYILV
jgi:hypothetical protein